MHIAGCTPLQDGPLHAPNATSLSERSAAGCCMQNERTCSTPIAELSPKSAGPLSSSTRSARPRLPCMTPGACGLHLRCVAVKDSMLDPFLCTPCTAADAHSRTAGFRVRIGGSRFRRARAYRFGPHGSCDPARCLETDADRPCGRDIRATLGRLTYD